MTSNGDDHAPLGRKERFSLLIGRVLGLVDVRSAFKILRSRGAAHHLGLQGVLVPGPEQDIMKASEYLEICQENALDAFTVEDALYWHNEIINELSIELNLLRATRWPQAVKASMEAALEDRLDQHTLIVMRLAAVLERDAPVKWQP